MHVWLCQGGHKRKRNLLIVWIECEEISTRLGFNCCFFFSNDCWSEVFESVDCKSEFFESEHGSCILWARLINGFWFGPGLALILFGIRFDNIADDSDSEIEWRFTRAGGFGPFSRSFYMFFFLSYGSSVQKIR